MLLNMLTIILPRHLSLWNDIYDGNKNLSRWFEAKISVRVLTMMVLRHREWMQIYSLFGLGRLLWMWTPKAIMYTMPVPIQLSQSSPSSSFKVDPYCHQEFKILRLTSTFLLGHHYPLFKSSFHNAMISKTTNSDCWYLYFDKYGNFWTSKI